MDYPICVDACPTGALQWVETDNELEEVLVKKRSRNSNNYREREVYSH